MPQGRSSNKAVRPAKIKAVGIYTLFRKPKTAPASCFRIINCCSQVSGFIQRKCIEPLILLYAAVCNFGGGIKISGKAVSSASSFFFQFDLLMFLTRNAGKSSRSCGLLGMSAPIISDALYPEQKSVSPLVVPIFEYCPSSTIRSCFRCTVPGML